MREKKVKRNMALLSLVFLLLFNSFIGVRAKENINLVIVRSTNEAKAGDTFTMSISFTSSQPVYDLRFLLQYPADLVEYKAIGWNESFYNHSETIKENNIIEFWIELEDAVDNTWIANMTFLVKDTASPGSSMDFIFVKEGDLPQGSFDDFTFADSSYFSLTNASVIVAVTPTPTPTKEPATPTPTKEPATPTPTKEPATPTPTKENETTASPETTIAPTDEVTDKPTPVITQTPKLVTSPGLDETLKPDKDITDGKNDAWAYIFWGLVSIIAGVWIGIGIGYMIWGRKRKGMFTFGR